MPASAAYIHVPFCRRRCGYCNFTVAPARRDLVPRYLTAVARELQGLGHPRPVQTLFFGGGTPSYLAEDELHRLVEQTRLWLPLIGEYEWTVEVNPEDVAPDLVSRLVDLGVNRISLGVQSFDNAKLVQLERHHDARQARRAIELCRDAFSSLAIDLIFAVPGEDEDVWAHDLAVAAECGCNHVSTYGLTYERGAAFWSRRRRGQLQAIEETVERRMYELAIDRLTAAGFEHYEVSNFAQPEHRCRHNITYWIGGEYYAAGPGAARYINGWRETNHRSTTTYLRKIEAGESPVAERECLTPRTRALERLVFSLRMLDGVDIDQFQAETGFTIPCLAGDLVRDFVELGFFEQKGPVLRLTRDGLMVSDSIWAYLLDEA